MKILMIHEVNEDILKINFDEYDIITFDDALYSVYYNKEILSKIQKRKIIFVSSDIIRENETPLEFIKCSDAHRLYRKGDKSPYMNLEELQELNSLGFEIGGHGYKHLRCKNFIQIKEEVEKCLEILKEFEITSYCLPYNQRNPLYSTYLKYKNLEIFGYGRIDANILVNPNYMYI